MKMKKTKVTSVLPSLKAFLNFIETVEAFFSATEEEKRSLNHEKSFATKEISLFPFSLITLWSITANNTDCSTGPLARPFARSLAPLTRSLASDCSLRSRPPLRSLVCSLAHFAHSLARGTVNDWMAILSVFFSIFDHSERMI